MVQLRNFWFKSGAHLFSWGTSGSVGELLVQLGNFWLSWGTHWFSWGTRWFSWVTSDSVRAHTGLVQLRNFWFSWGTLSYFFSVCIFGLSPSGQAGPVGAQWSAPRLSWGTQHFRPALDYLKTLANGALTELSFFSLS